MSDETLRPVLAGQKALVIGVANDDSIAYGCANAFHATGADLAITWLNEKARPYVEPLARGVPVFAGSDCRRWRRRLVPRAAITRFAFKRRGRRLDAGFEFRHDLAARQARRDRREELLGMVRAIYAALKFVANSCVMPTAVTV